MVKEITLERIRDIQFYLLVATTASIPFAVETFRFFVILLSIATVASTDWLSLKENFKSNKWILLPSVLGLLNLFGLLYTSNMVDGMKMLERGAYSVILPLIILMAPPSQERIRKVISLFTWICVLICMYCLLYAVWRYFKTGTVINADKISDREYNYFFNNELTVVMNISPIYLSLFLNFGIAYLLNKLIIERTGSLREIAILILLHVLQGFVFSLSAVLALCANWLIILFNVAVRTDLKRRMAIFTIFVAAIALSGVAAYNIGPIRERVFVKIETDFQKAHISHWNSMSIRLAIWRCAYDAIRDTPLIGNGTGDAEDKLLASFDKNKFALGSLIKLNSHNQYIQSYLMHGMLGMIALASILILPAYRAIRKSNWLMVMLLAMIALGCLTESLFVVQRGIVFFSIFFSLVYLLPEKQ